MSDFPLSRYKHCHSVGRKMYDYAKRILHLDEATCREMFVLGAIHDIGYELSSDAFEHDTAMATALCSYKYNREIALHSRLQLEYDSMAMRLLYLGVSTVDGQGIWCTLDERLKDLGKRYGLNSEVYTESLAIANHLKRLGFNDTIQLL